MFDKSSAPEYRLFEIVTIFSLLLEDFDDGIEGVDAIGTEVAHRDGSARKFVGAEPLTPRPLGQICQTGRIDQLQGVEIDAIAINAQN